MDEMNANAIVQTVQMWLSAYSAPNALYVVCVGLVALLLATAAAALGVMSGSLRLRAMLEDTRASYKTMTDHYEARLTTRDMASADEQDEYTASQLREYADMLRREARKIDDDPDLDLVADIAHMLRGIADDIYPLEDEDEETADESEALQLVEA